MSIEEEAISNFERYWTHKPMNELRKLKGLPETTMEDIKKGIEDDRERTKA